MFRTSDFRYPYKSMVIIWSLSFSPHNAHTYAIYAVSQSIGPYLLHPIDFVVNMAANPSKLSDWQLIVTKCRKTNNPKAKAYCPGRSIFMLFLPVAKHAEFIRILCVRLLSAIFFGNHAIHRPEDTLIAHISFYALRPYHSARAQKIKRKRRPHFTCTRFKCQFSYDFPAATEEIRFEPVSCDAWTTHLRNITSVGTKRKVVLIDAEVNERKSESYVLNAIIAGPHRIGALLQLLLLLLLFLRGR